MNDFTNMKSYLMQKIETQIPAITEQEQALKDIVALLINNEWYGLDIRLNQGDGENIVICDARRISEIDNKIDFFLEHYKDHVHTKKEVLLQLLKAHYPLTTNALTKYYREYGLDDEDQYMFNDFLLYSLKKDIQLYSNQDANTFVQIICEKLSIYDGNQILHFLTWVRKNFNAKYSLDFELAKRKLNIIQNTAYNSEMILQMVYYLFNDEYIKKNDLISRAAKYSEIANCWIYLALHCICALRDTDIIRIPHPRLQQEPGTILESAITGMLDYKTSMVAVNSVLWQLKNRPLKPEKTSSFSNVSDIKLIIPKSTEELFGTMFSLSEAHHKKNKNKTAFITPVKDYKSITKYLGDDIGELFLENDFHARSANKAYMQAIELLSDAILDGDTLTADSPHTKGYMLAALARSHKGSYGEFCKTTEVYLKDAVFSGYSAAQVAQELFERGVCSFVVSMLLNIVTERDYKKLSISKQTQLIKSVGLSVWETDTFITAYDNALESAQNMVNQILLILPEQERETKIVNILHNIGTGRAAAKSDDFLCLLTAMNKPCPYHDSDQCIGCKYEIITQASVFSLVKEFQRLLYLREQTNISQLKQKYTLLLKDVMAPVLSELFAAIRSEYGEEVLADYNQIIEEVLNESSRE